MPMMYALLTPAQRRQVREDYVSEQGGLCYHCKTPLSEAPSKKLKVNRKLFPPGFFTHPVHLHHSHETGFTIGAVHAYCNAVLWQYHGE